MDVTAIRDAVNARLEELELKNEELRLRMAEIRGSASTRIVDLLIHDRPKKFFERDILRAASIALEWPEDALEVIEADGTAPDQLPHRPWGAASDDGQAPARVEEELDVLRHDLAATRDEVEGLRASVGSLTQAVLRLLEGTDEELTAQQLADRLRDAQGPPR